MRYKRLLLVFISAFFLILASSAEAAGQPQIPKVSGENGDVIVNNTFFLSGETAANTEVLIYLDGTYYDLAVVKTVSPDASEFSYESGPINPGEHTIFIIAKDKTSLVLSPPLEMKIIVSPLAAPTLFQPDNNRMYEEDILIKGVSVSETSIKVYANNELILESGQLISETGASGFILKPKVVLGSGSYEFWAISERENGEKSEISNKIAIRIIEHTPAPILLSAKKDSGLRYPSITGIAKNNLIVKIFIDKELSGELRVNNDKSGTANFSYQLNKDLNRGGHEIYAVSVDSIGKTSKKSNILKFAVKNPKISDSASEPADEYLENSVSMELTEPLLVFPESNTQADEDVSKDVMIQEIKEGGLVNESRKKYDRLNSSSTLFILFILGVIAWIVWVNKRINSTR